MPGGKWLNQHPAIGTEGMELEEGGSHSLKLGGLRSTPGAMGRPSNAHWQGVIPMAVSTGGKLASPASHLRPAPPGPASLSQTLEVSLWERSSEQPQDAAMARKSPPSRSLKHKHRSGPPFAAWREMLHPQDARALGCPSIHPAVPGQPPGLHGCHRFTRVGNGTAGSLAEPAPAPRLITAISLPVPPPRCLPPASVCCLVLRGPFPRGRWK